MSRRPARPPRFATVLRRSVVTPHLFRVVLGGPGLADFEMNEYADGYVKLLFVPPDAPYRAPYDPEQVRAEQPADHWPVMRTYTVRAWDADVHELTVDVVHHGDEGYAGPWAANAEPGDLIGLLGPGGAYAPRLDVDAHVLVGDESALPAIAVALERMPAGVPAVVLVEVADAGEQQALESAADLQVTWLHRSADHPDALLDALRATPWPDGAVQAFVHGEAGAVRDVRRFLRGDRGLDPALLSASGYWRRGCDDEGWRASKSEWKAAVDADDAALTAG